MLLKEIKYIHEIDLEFGKIVHNLLLYQLAFNSNFQISVIQRDYILNNTLYDQITHQVIPYVIQGFDNSILTHDQIISQMKQPSTNYNSLLQLLELGQLSEEQITYLENIPQIFYINDLENPQILFLKHIFITSNSSIIRHLFGQIETTLNDDIDFDIHNNHYDGTLLNDDIITTTKMKQSSRILCYNILWSLFRTSYRQPQGALLHIPTTPRQRLDCIQILQQNIIEQTESNKFKIENNIDF